MITSEVKIAIIATGGLCTVIGMYIAADQLEKKRNVDIDQLNRQRKSNEQIKIAEIEATYPPEYWLAKKAETEAASAEKQARIESEERLAIDKREREAAEAAAIREFEKDAPESYWQHKRFQEEEKTRREQLAIEDARRKRLEEQEHDIAKRNARAIEEGAKTIERAVRTAHYASTLLP